LFALPFAFRLIGIGGGLLSMFAAGVLTYYTNLLIVRTKDVIARDTLRKNLTYVCECRTPPRPGGDTGNSMAG